jgi:hypothetical protein
MSSSLTLKQPYDICVIDIGSPKLGNIGWCHIETATNHVQTGQDLDDAFPLIAKSLDKNSLILGLEAPLFVPLRDDIMLATKARLGEGRRPWSAGAGAQVLAMNLPIMNYIFRHLKRLSPDLFFAVNDQHFTGKAGEVMIFEALVSGTDKGNTHMDDARIMAEYCVPYSQSKALPPTILEPDSNTTFMNLAGMAAIHTGFTNDTDIMHCESPIYKPTTDVYR